MTENNVISRGSCDCISEFSFLDLESLILSKKQWYDYWPNRLDYEKQCLSKVKQYSNFVFPKQDGNDLILEGSLKFKPSKDIPFPWDKVTLKLSYPILYPFFHIWVYDVDKIVPPGADNHKFKSGAICLYFPGSGYVNPRRGDTIVKVLDAAVSYFALYVIKSETGNWPLKSEPHSPHLTTLKYVLEGHSFNNKDLCPCGNSSKYYLCCKKFVKEHINYAKKRIKQLGITPEELVYNEEFIKIVKPSLIKGMMIDNN